MTQARLARRVLAGATSVVIGLAGALAIGAPASATGDDIQPYWMPTERTGVDLTGTATCDEETDTWTVEWTITNERLLQAVVNSLSSEVEGVGINHVFPGGHSDTGTQTFPGGTESATLTVELKWAFEVPTPDGPKWIIRYQEATATVELGECRPKPPEQPEEPETPAGPEIVVFVTCDLLGFIIDNSTGEGEVTVTLTPDQTVTHGHASGFSYAVDEEGNIEVIATDDAGIHQVVGDADGDNPAVLGPFPAGADPHTHAFEAEEGLTVTVDLSVDGDSVKLENDVATWTADGLADCPGEPGSDDGDDNGQGGELPKTGTSSTMLIAGGAMALLVLGGGLYLLARRRRVTFTA